MHFSPRSCYGRAETPRQLDDGPELLGVISVQPLHRVASQRVERSWYPRGQALVTYSQEAMVKVRWVWLQPMVLMRGAAILSRGTSSGRWYPDRRMGGGIDTSPLICE